MLIWRLYSRQTLCGDVSHLRTQLASHIWVRCTAPIPLALSLHMMCSPTFITNDRWPIIRSTRTILISLPLFSLAFVIFYLAYFDWSVALLVVVGPKAMTQHWLVYDSGSGHASLQWVADTRELRQSSLGVESREKFSLVGLVRKTLTAMGDHRQTCSWDPARFFRRRVPFSRTIEWNSSTALFLPSLRLSKAVASAINRGSSTCVPYSCKNASLTVFQSRLFVSVWYHTSAGPCSCRWNAANCRCESSTPESSM